MERFKITNLKQALELAENEKLSFSELLLNKMEETGIKSYRLAKKMSSTDAEYQNNIDPNTIYSYLKIKAKEKPKHIDEERLKSIAEALGTTHYELLSSTASVNRDVDELPDDSYYWMESIVDIKQKLHELSVEHVELICKLYKEILSIPDGAIDIASMYILLDKESQEQFIIYMNVLSNENNQSKSFDDSTQKVFEIFEKITFVENVSEKMDSFDLFQLLKNTFPNKQNIEEVESFNLYLYLLLNNDWRKIAKNYLLLDSVIKKEMILRIADQMVITLEK